MSIGTLKRIRRLRPLRLGLVLLFVAPIASVIALQKTFTLSGTSLSLEEVSSEVGVFYTSMRFNRASKVWNVEVSLTNQSSHSLSGPMVLLVDSFTGTTGPLLADGADENAKAFYDLSATSPNGVLAPRSRSLTRTLTLGFAGGAPQLNTRVFVRPATLPVALALTRTLDEVGQPLADAQVIETGPVGLLTNRTDPVLGFTTLGQGSGSHVWRFISPGRLPVWRLGTLTTNQVTIIPDPRLAARSTNVVTLTPISGGAITNDPGGVQVSFPPASVVQNTTVSLTPLTGQTLPAFLPIGWSPLRAFSLELATEPTLGGTATSQLPAVISNGESAVLTRWNPISLVWDALQVLVGDGTAQLAFPLGGSGVYAVVVPDKAPFAPPVAVVGQPLQGGGAGPPNLATLTATGKVEPDSSPASRSPELVTAMATVVISNSAGPLPSGLLLRGEVRENYRLRDAVAGLPPAALGISRQPPQYENFVVGYQRPGDDSASTLQATFPLRPLLLFGAEELDEAAVIMDVLSPTPFAGGVLDTNGGLLASQGIGVLAGAGDLVGQQAAELRSLDLTNFSDFNTNGMVVTAALELAVSGVAPGHHLVAQFGLVRTNSLFVLSRVLYDHGLYGLQPIERLASDALGRLSSSEPSLGEHLPGLADAGQYLLVRVTAPQGLISGIARNSTGQPTAGMPAQVSGQPWLALSRSNGAFQILAPAGAAQLVLSDLISGDAGVTAITVTDPVSVTTANPNTIASGPTVVSVSPTNGAVGVSRVASIVVNFSKPINPATLLGGGIQLLGTNGPAVAASLSLNLKNTTATLLPIQPLAPNTPHTILVSSNIADFTGLSLQGQTTFTFSTESDALNRIPAQLTSFAPTNGVARVEGSAGSADPNAPVILLNETTGRTTTVISKTDGSFQGSVEANPEDVLSAVLVNSNGTRTVLPVSRVILDDGGIVLFGGGGVVSAHGELGDVSLTIDPGAIPGASVIRLDAVSSNQVQTLVNNVPPLGARLVGQAFALSVSGDQMQSAPHISVPVDVGQLDLQPGERPEDAVFALVAITRVGGHVGYCVADTMKYEAGRLKTSSPPFDGPDVQSLEGALRERGLTIGALSNQLETNQAIAQFADEFAQVTMNVSEINSNVASRLQTAYPVAFPALATAAQFFSYLSQFDPTVRLASDLFAISYAPIQIARARKVTVTGSVVVGVKDPSGNVGAFRPVAGAVVSLHPLAGSAQFLPGRIDEGFIYALSDKTGKYALVADNTAVPFSGDRTVAGFLVTATHPRFFAQRPVQGVELSAVVNTYRADLVFADVDLNEPTRIPPFIAASHTPAFPATNQTAVLTIRSTQGAERPTISKPIVAAVTPLVPGAPTSLNDVTITGPTNQLSIGDHTAQADFLVTSTNSVNALLAIQAATSTSGPRQIGYEIIFSGATPPDPGNIQSPDLNDVQPPTVARTVPPKNGLLGLGQAIEIEFSEPIRRDILTQPAAVQLDPPAGVPQLSLSADQQRLEIGYPDLAPDTSYVLTLQSTIQDLRGNALDAGVPNSRLTFRTAPQVQATLPGIQNGGGVVIQGNYAFALDRGASPALVSYDLSKPSQPVALQTLTLPVPFRDLAIIPSYRFVLKPGQPVLTNTLLAIVGGDFAPFFDELGNESFGGQYLRIYDVSNPSSMIRLAARRISASVGAATKIRWSPPVLVYLNSSDDFQEIGLVNLQSFIIGANLTPEEFQQLPLDPQPGEDKNGDGDYVDPGETLPLPGRDPGTFAGKVGAFVLDDTTQRIQDFSYDDANGNLSVVLGDGQSVSIFGEPGDPLSPSFRTMVSHGQVIPKKNATQANFPITAGRPKRVFTLLNTSLTTTNGSINGDFALVSVVPDGAAAFSGLLVLDISDPLSVHELGRLEVPVDEGLAQSLQALPNGLLALATSQHMLLLDPNKLLGINATGGLHPAIVGKISGAGSGSISPSATGFGLFASNLGAKQALVQTSPLLVFVSNLDTNSIVEPKGLSTTPGAAEQAFEQLRVTSELIPATFRSLTNKGKLLVPSTLFPPASQVHYHVMVFAPGSAGSQIQVALESLNASGYPLRNKGSGFPPVSALDPATRTQIGQPFRQGCDVTGSSLTAFRLSDDRLDPLFNVFLSKPFALMYEAISQTEIDQLRSQLDREILWSGHFLRASLDPAMAANPVIGPFASRLDGDEGVILPLAAALVQTLPADYIIGPNPPPANGFAVVPRTMVSAHNGEFRTTAEDFALPSRRMPIEFRRHIGGQDLYDGPFGRGWDFEYNQRLIELSGGIFLPGMKLPLVIRGNGNDEIGQSKDVLFQTGEGRTILYSIATNNPPDEYKNDLLVKQLGWLSSAQDFYLPPEGIFDLLMRFHDGRFVRLEPDGTQYWYSPRGRLEKIQDRYPANVIVLEYNERGELSRIRDDSVTADRFLKIGYFRKSGQLDADRPDKLAPNQASIGKICSLEDYTQRQVDFEYDDCGHLIRKKGINISNGGPEGFTGREITEYGYGSTLGSANDVRSVREGSQSGNAVFKADSVVETAGVPVVQGGTGAFGTYSVRLQQDNTAAAIAAGNAGTMVTKPDQSQFQFAFHPDARLAKLNSAGAGAQPAATVMEYTNGLVRKFTYPEGNSTTYRYDDSPTTPLRSRANVLGILRDPGASRPGPPIPEATYTYNPEYNFPDGPHTDFNGNQIVYSSSTAGLDIGGIRYPGAGDLSLTYNDHGQLETIGSVEGIETDYTYRTGDGFIDHETTGSLQTHYSYTGPAGERGLPGTVTPPEGAPFSRTYNEVNELLTETRAGTVYSRILSYDVNANRIRTESAVDAGKTLVEHLSFLQNGFLATNTFEAIETLGASQPLTTVYEPDSMFRVRSITYPGGLQRRTYDQFDHLGRAHLMSLGNYSETYDFDLNGNLRSVIHGLITDQFHYDGYDRLTEADVAVDGGIEVTTRSYYGNGEIASVAATDSSGNVNLHQGFGIDSFGRRTSVTNATTDLGDAVTGIAYDGSSRTVTITDAVGEQSVVSYNSAGQRITQNDVVRQLSYDFGGNLNLQSITSTENGSQFLSQFIPYNGLNQSLALSDGLGKISDLEPRTDGALKSVVNARTNRTQYTLSELGEPLSRTRADGMSFSYEFQPHRAIAKVQDSSNAGNSYDYDSAFRLQKTTYRDGSTTVVNAFDVRNNMPTDVSIPGGHLTLGYDARGRMTSRTVDFQGDSRVENFSYDALDRITSATFPAGSRTYTFDKLGPLRDSLLTVLGQQYDTSTDIRGDGFRTTLRYPAPQIAVAEGRDSAGRLTSVVPSQGDPVVSSMVYASADRVGVHLLGGTNFLRSDSFYDARKRLLGRRYTRASSGQVLAEVRYVYDPADNVTARQYLHRSGRTDLFSYDNGERLERADVGAHPPVSPSVLRTLPGFNPVLSGWSPGFFAREYVYSPGGLDSLLSAAVVDPDNLPLLPFTTNFTGLGSFLDVQNTDGFARQTDQLGNAKRVRLWVRPRNAAAPLPVGATLTYNGLSQLIRVERDDGVTVVLDYQQDGLCCHRRVQDAALPGGVEETVFVYNDGLLLAEYDRTAGANRLKARYYYAEADVPVAADLADAGGQLRRYYLLQENNGSIMGLVDVSGNLVERYFYDAWGQLDVQVPDTLPPVLDQVVAVPDGLLIQFSEPVLPPVVDPGAPALASSFRSFQTVITLTVDGHPIAGSLQYEESSSAGFGRTLHLFPGSALTGTNAVLTVAAGQLLDEWNNPNPAQTISFVLNASSGATNFVRAPRTPTQPGPMARSSIGNALLFHGQYFDYDLGLVYLRARYYDPATGQFLQRDPLQYKDSVNLYAGFGYNPVSRRDPAGTAKTAIVFESEGLARISRWLEEFSPELASAETRIAAHNPTRISAMASTRIRQEPVRGVRAMSSRVRRLVNESTEEEFRKASLEVAEAAERNRIGSEATRISRAPGAGEELAKFGFEAQAMRDLNAGRPARFLLPNPNPGSAATIGFARLQGARLQVEAFSIENVHGAEAVVPQLIGRAQDLGRALGVKELELIAGQVEESSGRLAKLLTHAVEGKRDWGRFARRMGIEQPFRQLSAGEQPLSVLAGQMATSNPSFSLILDLP